MICDSANLTHFWVISFKKNPIVDLSLFSPLLLPHPCIHKALSYFVYISHLPKYSFDSVAHSSIFLVPPIVFRAPSRYPFSIQGSPRGACLSMSNLYHTIPYTCVVVLNPFGVINAFENLVKAKESFPRKMHIPSKVCIQFHRTRGPPNTHQQTPYSAPLNSGVSEFKL